MNQTSVLTCTRIRVRAVPGRTDGLISGLQAFVNALFDRPDAFDYAELHLLTDGDARDLYWMGDEQPAFDPSLTAAISAAAEVDLLLNLSGETDCMADAHAALSSLLADGSLSDCARMICLRTGDDFAALTLSGIHGGAFLHGEVPFADGCEGVPADMCWNSCTHRARFHFPEEALDDAWDLSELLPERIDEIDFEFSFDRAELVIHSVQLTDLNGVEVYREVLQHLADLSDGMEIAGALTPESDSAFALMRFAPDGSRVSVQTAVAEF